jgi:D-alanine-D-alanine ligase
MPAAAKRDLKIMFIAKHVHWQEGLHSSDGSHALYHREIRQTLEAMGLNLVLADSYDALFQRPQADFVFPLLNRGGFLNSEMLLPLLCERHGLAYLGASPILRGLSDDKDLTKGVAVAKSVPTRPWTVYRRGAPIDPSRCPPAPRYIVKPNASSASWGISAATSWDEVHEAILGLHQQGHDALVETFITGHDIEVSVITLNGEPLVLPTQIVEQENPDQLRTYSEKRNLVDSQGYQIRPLEPGPQRARAEELARTMIEEYRPFDYGRFEFRQDIETGDIYFLEINLNCNLWSKKTIAMAAAQMGWSHAELIETILTESLQRHGLIERTLDRAA